MIALDRLSKGLLVLLLSVSCLSGYFYWQDSVDRRTSLDQIRLLEDQMRTSNQQVASLNQEIVRLENLNVIEGGNNQQLLSQIELLNSQIATLEAQVKSVNSEILALTQTINLQRTSNIATSLTLDYTKFTNTYYLIPLPPINYEGYFRISWLAQARYGFVVQVFDINITTPSQVSGVFDVPVAQNATTNMMIHCYDTVYNGNGGQYVCVGTVTYSIQYWY